MPIAPASDAAMKATETAIRDEKIRRDSTQRPRLSVPRGKLASPPCIQAGGNWAESRSCSIGSCGASGGANSATKSSKATTAPPTQSRGPPRLSAAIHGAVRSIGALTARSTIAQPRVQQRDQNIDDKIEGDEENSKGQDQSLDQGEIAVDHRVDRHIADPLIGEDAFDQHRSPQQQRDLDAAECDRRNQRVREPLPQQDRRTRKSPRSCYLRVILILGLRQRGLEQARDQGSERQCERNRRKDHMSEQRARDVETSRHEAFNQIEIGPEGDGELRIDPA